MANISTNMTNPIRGLVSKRRKRYQKDGFNLDLAYIQPNIIAMGFPAENLEGVYRNHIDDVLKFLELKHKTNYKIYNLCSERSYDCNKFHCRVSVYGFEDHFPPKIELIQEFCNDMHKWLSADSENVAAVHCKAGKGRTGTMICCFMLHDNLFDTADGALKHYAEKRTYDKKGVTIPSQRRYVEYYARLLKSGKQYTPVSMQICEIILSPPPLLSSYQGIVYFSISEMNGKKLYVDNFPEIKKSHGGSNNSSDRCISIKLDRCIPLIGDIKVEFHMMKTIVGKEKFHICFNTYFANEFGEEISSTNGEPPNILYRFKKNEIDNAHKDKTEKFYPPDFEVQLVLQKIPSGTFARADNQINHKTEYNEANTPSESSEASSSDSSNEEDGIWESDTRRHHQTTRDSSSNDVRKMMDLNRRMSHFPLSEGVVSLLSKKLHLRPRREST